MTEVAPELSQNDRVEEPGQEEAGGLLEIDGKRYEMPRDFKIGELKILERYTGQTLGEIEWVSADAFAAVALIIKRREDADFDEDLVDELSIRWQDVEEEGAEKADPPSASPGDSGDQT